jgi:hypothetical protein
MNLPESSHEDHQPSSRLHLPRLYFSSLSYREVLDQITGQEAFLLKPEEGMKAYVKEIKENATNDVEVILRIQETVAKDLNSWKVPMEHTGYQVRTPIQTWKSQGGTATEKTLLMVTLLREAGINANPVLVLPTKLYDQSTGCLPLV